MYHGCVIGFRDGTRIPIGCSFRNKMSFKEKCVLATGEPFWKHADDIQNKAETRSSL